MRIVALLAGAITILGAAGPALAANNPPNDTIDVSFREAVGDRFVGVINLVLGTETARRVNSQHYLFRIGSRGGQNDYAVAFAHLPYVKGVLPTPRYNASEREMPNVLLNLPFGQPGANPAPAPRRAAPGARRPGYVPRQLIVKFKQGIPADAIAQFNAEQGVALKQHIDGIDANVYALPGRLSVAEAQKRYANSGMVEYAQPNRVMSLPGSDSTGPASGLAPDVPPADNGGPGIYLSPRELYGATLLVRYRTGGSAPELVNQVLGTCTLEQTEADQTRLSLPARWNPLVAQRIFRLCPDVMQAEPAYGR